MMSVSKVFSPTPFLLIPGFGKLPDNLLFPDFQLNGSGSQLFQKGRAALGYILKKLSFLNPTRNEIIFPAYNAQSLAIASIYANLKIRLVDVDVTDFFFNEEKFNATLSNKTLVVIFPYNWGIFPEIEKIKRLRTLVKNNGSFVIDDFASSVPKENYLEYFNKNADILLFSFGKTKIFSLLDGGYVFINEKFSYYEILKSEFFKDEKRLIKAGSITDIKKTISNIPYKIYTHHLGFWFFTKLGLTQNERLPQDCNFDDKPLKNFWRKRLRKMIDYSYKNSNQKRLLCNKEYYSAFEKLKNITLFTSTEKCIGSRFPILMSDRKTRDNAKSVLNSANIGAGSGFVSWMGGNDFLKDHIDTINEMLYPGAVNFEGRILTLPAHAKVNKSDISRIVENIKKCL